MRFKLWLEYGDSSDYQGKMWYHGTANLTQLLQSKRLKTRKEGVRAKNAAALGIGVYLTDDLEEAQAFVPIGVDGGVVGVQIVQPVKLLRLTNSLEDKESFEYLRSLGLSNPDKAKEKVTDWGYQGVHWDMRDGWQKVVVYNPSVLSNVTLIARSITTPGTLDRSWDVKMGSIQPH